jgi:hypothetical protein
VAETPLGLDLERRDAVRAAQLRLVLSDDERAALATGALDATDAWVMKEAVLKAAGQGAHAARAVALRGALATLDGREWRLTRVPLPRTHVGWLATDGPLEALDVEAVGDATALPAAT